MMEQTKLYVDKNITFEIESYDPSNPQLDQLFVDLIPVAWNEVLYGCINEIRDAGRVLNRLILKENHDIVPHPWNVFRALALCPPDHVKVVIIGQDPYYIKSCGRPSATGCCFETAAGCKVERSLGNIFSVLSRTIPDFELPRSGELTKWAEQGVLLLNAALTTNAGEANKHAAIWEFLTKRVLEYLSKTKKGVVYMLWGAFARNLAEKIDKRENLILEASHPVARANNNTFLKCDHFNEANRYLTANGIDVIDWRL